jgi:hypothetical protein
MKRLLIFILLFGLIASSYAQSRLGVTTDASLVWQIDDIDNTTAKTGAALSIGGLYQFQHKKFLANVGFTFSPAWLRQGVDKQEFTVDMLDTEGYPFTYKSSINKRIDRITAMDLTIPLMVGFTVDGVYALMGAKFCVTVSGKTYQKAYLTTVGDYGDRYYEIEKAGNVRPLSYYFARLLGIMTVVMVVSLGTTLLSVYWYVFSRGGVDGFGFGFVIKDAFLRVWKYVIGLMLPILLAIVSATLCLGNLFRNALVAALGSLAFIVANYLYCYIGNITGWQPYFEYLSTHPSKLRWVIAAYDRGNPIEVMNSFFTSPKHAMICIGIAVGAALLYSIIAHLRIRSREI